ncbi:Hsp33 family molecular chaperone HslO [Marinimicrobium sp. ABcell2]|uniref:Hsp33 family molecular chaperone HslO n=1 Tax=Marinimicrobium sp. ABcell2 TaxID=3069751 RepID=UPI0027AF43C0|nr:Hsp33 family molecular chaperone HslO [Marinimicrobium sp. ABcell2]MDQ2076058.1 Hsp33 family molecular chaperone HslO [Marinimicrobium sp. ABcell2]
MTDKDVLHRFLFDDCDVRGEIVTLVDSYQEVLSNNHYPAPIQRLLGEFLAAASLLSSTLKFDGMISIQAKGDGPVAMIMAECNKHRDLRGIARLNPDAPQVANEEHSLRALLGQGVIAITIEPDKGQRYQGLVPMESDTLAGCLEHYFYQSEQLKTRLWFAADDQVASGFLLQALPRQLHGDEEENQDHWETLCALSDTLSREEMLGLDQKTLLYRLFHEQPLRLFDPANLRFSCNCSRERSAQALLSLGREDVEELLVERGSIDIDCQFCNRHYHFDAADVRALVGGDTLH